MGEWIAIVDENVDNLRAAGKVLSGEGYKVSALRSRDDLVGFLRGNAPDMIFFGVSNPRRLLARVKGEAFDEQQKAAGKDPVTGLMEAAPLQAAISEKLKETAGAVLMFSIEGFELVDELYGEQKGDALLSRFADHMSSVLRASDPVGRIGRSRFLGFGEHIREEFVVAEKREFLKDLLHTLQSEIFGEEHPLPLNLLIGVVVCPDEGREYSTMFQKAEEAIYKAGEQPDRGYSFYWSNRRPEDDGLLADQDEVLALLREREIQKGAYLMPFEQFRTVCRLLIRLKNYHDVRAVLIRFNIEALPGAEEDSQGVDRHFIHIAARSLRTSDVMTRRGGDHCSVLLPYTDKQYGTTVAERILERWNESEYAGSSRITYDLHNLE